MPSKPSSSESLGIIIVAFGHDQIIEQLAHRISAQKQAGDYVVIVDNHPDHKSATAAESLAAFDLVIRSKNVGFAAACNLAAAQLPAKVGLIMLMNPDVLPDDGALDRIRRPAESSWSAWMGLLLKQDGTVNSAGNVLHLSGLSWCGAYGEPAKRHRTPEAVDYLTGACCVIRRKVWQDVGGLDERFFLYYEDTELSLRLRRLGHKLGLVPGAVFRHDYQFEPGPYKFFYLERNRYFLIIQHWPLAVMVLSLPLLVLCEIALWLISFKQRRLQARLRAVISAILLLKQSLQARQNIQKSYPVGAAAFLGMLSAEIDTTQITIGKMRNLINVGCRLYYRFIFRAVTFLSRGR